MVRWPGRAAHVRSLSPRSLGDRLRRVDHPSLDIFLCQLSSAGRRRLDPQSVSGHSRLARIAAPATGRCPQCDDRPDQQEPLLQLLSRRGRSLIWRALSAKFWTPAMPAPLTLEVYNDAFRGRARRHHFAEDGIRSLRLLEEKVSWRGPDNRTRPPWQAKAWTFRLHRRQRTQNFRPGIPGIRRQWSRCRGLGRLVPKLRLSRHGQAPQHERVSLSQRQGQYRSQCRTPFLRPILLPDARPLGLRHRHPGG